MKAYLLLFAVVASACPERTAPDAGVRVVVDAGSPAMRCPRTIPRAEIDAARKAFDAFDGGTHELPVGDGGCWRLEEERWRYGPSKWTLREVTPNGLRKRMAIELNYREGATDRCAGYLEHPGQWEVSSEWTACAEHIETCRDAEDGGVGPCFGFAFH